MKKCPFCAEEIQDEAIVCRYCGRGQPGYEEKVAELESKKTPAAEEIAKEPEEPKKGNSGNAAFIAILVVALICVGIIFLPLLGSCSSSGNSSKSSSGSSSSSSSVTITCSDYSDEPVAWTKGSGRIDIYGGVEEPRTDDVKGTVDPGAAMRVERQCGTWYRVQGVDWWGWIRGSNINWSGD